MACRSGFRQRHLQLRMNRPIGDHGENSSEQGCKEGTMKAAPKKAPLRKPAAKTASKQGPPKNPRGGREALTVAQLVALYKALLSNAPAWTAVLFLMQLMMGDRADCARRCSTNWLWLVSPKPYINIPENVNGKTTARKVPIHSDYAKWLFSLMGSPLLPPSSYL